MAAVGTLTVTRTKEQARTQKVSFAWTCTAGGAVSGIFAELVGIIRRVSFDPTDGPTANYDVVLNDAEGVDLLAGLGANRNTTNTETVYPLLGAGTDVPAVACGPVELQVANAGASKSGVVHVYLEK